jgi:hypothetical protein
MAGGYYFIDLEDRAIPFNKGSSRTMPEPCMEMNLAQHGTDRNSFIQQLVTPKSSFTEEGWQN